MARFKQAIALYRAALEELTREREKRVTPAAARPF